MKWIRVTESLPDYDKRCLVFLGPEFKLTFAYYKKGTDTSPDNFFFDDQCCDYLDWLDEEPIMWIYDTELWPEVYK